MEILIVETGNTEDGATVDKILSKFAICKTEGDKKRALPGFTQPTCTKDTFLLKEAKKYNKLFKKETHTMPTESIKSILMRRDEMSPKDANDLIMQAKEDLNNRLTAGETPDDICMEWFGLEPDYIDQLLD